MQEHIDGAQTSASPGYETRDTNAKLVLWFVTALFLVVAGSMVAMWGLFDHYSASQPLGPSISPFASGRVLPPEPRLQVQPTVDLQKMRESQNEILQSYGWVDKANGTVRIPIDRAMDLLLQRGLPTRQSPPSEQSTTEVKKEQPK